MTGSTVTDSPVSKLADPQPSDPIPDLVELIINGNAVSPSYWINYVLKSTIGYDPLTYTTNSISGDWEAMQKAGTAIGNLSDYLVSYKLDVSQAARTANETWDGNAADSAMDYFKELTAAISTQASALKDISTTIEEYSLSSYAMAQVVCGMLQEVFDYVIILAIKYAASAVMASTGIGAVGSAAAIASSAFEIAMIIERWQDALGTLTTWVMKTEAAASVVVGGAAMLSGTSLPQVPGGGYDHPGVS
ncbi:WXG100 family type VII secretion target [Nocardia sp. SSK8]|uniref:WXG100 family type VII secretion target n=1 Tax=Nocardia sp. SSK8 TaxID=3120154 RepID=UPI00300BB2C6